MKLSLNVNEARLNERDLTVDERLLIMGAGNDLEAARDLLAWFLVDSEGKYMQERAAKRIIGKVRRSEEAEVIGQFRSALIDALLPNASASSSS